MDRFGSKSAMPVRWVKYPRKAAVPRPEAMAGKVPLPTPAPQKYPSKLLNFKFRHGERRAAIPENEAVAQRHFLHTRHGCGSIR
jgi:hypothetical protein